MSPPTHQRLDLEILVFVVNDVIANSPILLELRELAMVVIARIINHVATRQAFMLQILQEVPRKSANNATYESRHTSSPTLLSFVDRIQHHFSQGNGPIASFMLQD